MPVVPRAPRSRTGPGVSPVPPKTTNAAPWIGGSAPWAGAPTSRSGFPSPLMSLPPETAHPASTSGWSPTRATTRGPMAARSTLAGAVVPNTRKAAPLGVGSGANRAPGAPTRRSPTPSAFTSPAADTEVPARSPGVPVNTEAPGALRREVDRAQPGAAVDHKDTPRVGASVFGGAWVADRKVRGPIGINVTNTGGDGARGQPGRWRYRKMGGALKLDRSNCGRSRGGRKGADDKYKKRPLHVANYISSLHKPANSWLELLSAVVRARPNKPRQKLVRRDRRQVEFAPRGVNRRPVAPGDGSGGRDAP